jgi:hypothetical protein
MEPVFMILGQSAATAGVMAIDRDIPVQALEYADLRAQLLADGQVLQYRGPVQQLGRGVPPASLDGVVVDDTRAERHGDWQGSRATGRFVGQGYLHDGNNNKGECYVRFEAQIPRRGQYELRLAYAFSGNRASNVPVTVRCAAGETVKMVNQKKEPPIEGTWISLGTFEGVTSQPMVVTVSNADTDGHVIADAIQLLPVDSPGNR